MDDLFRQPFYPTKAPYLLPNGTFLWAATMPPDFLLVMSENYNYCHGITMVSHTRDYIEVINLGGPANEIECLHFLLNEKHLIQLFVKYVIKEALAEEKFLRTTRGYLADHLTGPIPPKENTKIKQVLAEIEACSHVRKNHNLMLIGDNLVGLSDREKQCVSYLQRGYSNKMIAQDLDISHRTIEKYFEKIYEKCNLKGRHELLHVLVSD